MVCSKNYKFLKHFNTVRKLMLGMPKCKWKDSFRIDLLKKSVNLRKRYELLHNRVH